MKKLTPEKVTKFLWKNYNMKIPGKKHSVYLGPDGLCCLTDNWEYNDKTHKHIITINTGNNPFVSERDLLSMVSFKMSNK